MQKAIYSIANSQATAPEWAKSLRRMVTLRLVANDSAAP